MSDTKTNLFHTGEFAKKAGVTERTLRWYDRQGLLSPAEHTDGGQRLYSQLDFIKLQQIVTLKFIGLSLGEIKQLVTADKVAVKQLLVNQRVTLENRLKQLQEVIFTLSVAERSVSLANGDQTIDAEQFVEVIKAVHMSTKFSWFNKFYSDDQRAKLGERSKDWTAVDQEKITVQWNTLFADIRANMDLDPASAEAQALVERWDGLVGQFTQGDPGIKQSLNSAYANIDESPPEVKQWADSMKDVNAFIQKARDAKK
ncbi:MAG: MerR family transcriptional regulator [Patescibacteria group bacterium]